VTEGIRRGGEESKRGEGEGRGNDRSEIFLFRPSLSFNIFKLIISLLPRFWYSSYLLLGQCSRLTSLLASFCFQSMAWLSVFCLLFSIFADHYTSHHLVAYYSSVYANTIDNWLHSVPSNNNCQRKHYHLLDQCNWLHFPAATANRLCRRLLLHFYDLLSNTNKHNVSQEAETRMTSCWHAADHLIKCCIHRTDKKKLKNDCNKIHHEQLISNVL